VALVWELGPKLGSGGMADVYLAIVRERSGTRLLALKRLRPGSFTPGMVAQLKREAEIGALLKHPNVVQLEASGEDELGPWLAMEYVAGCSARRVLRAHLELGRTLPPGVAAAIACDAAKGLAYVHSVHDPDRGLHDLVHRDISSDNILVDLDGKAKLADFGVARIAGAVGLTRAGHFKGKLGYAAPELVEGAPPTHKSDYFAMAATVYELFTGRYAFVGKNEVETLNNLVNRPPPLLTDAPKDVAEWVAQAFERSPKHRPDSLTGLVLALGRSASPPAEVARVMHDVGVDAGVHRADAITTQLSKGPGRRRWWLGAIPAAVAASGAFALLRPAEEAPPRAPAPVIVPPAPAEPSPAPLPPAPLPPAPVPPEPVPPEPLTPARAEGARVRASPRGRTAVVKFDIKPWADIWHDGRKLGIAPMERKVPIGRQTFEVRNPELGAAVITTIDVTEEGPNVLTMDLHEQP